MGFDGKSKNEYLYLINPGILSKIDSGNKYYLDLLITIKSICFYFFKKINNMNLDPKLLLLLIAQILRVKKQINLEKSLKEFEDLEQSISVDFIIIDRWEKNLVRTKIHFSSNEVILLSKY